MRVRSALFSRAYYDIIAMRYYMRKVVTSLLCAFLFAGCFMRRDNSADFAAYEGFYKSILDNDKFQEGSLYYQISAEMSTLADGSHRYYIFLDDAQIAMYDVVMLAIENGTPFEGSTKMMPSIGVFESQDYSLIPYQARTEKGYVKGLVLSGETAEDSVDIALLVEWRDKNKENAYREYLSFSITEAGYTAVTRQMPAEQPEAPEEAEQNEVQTVNE